MMRFSGNLKTAALAGLFGLGFLAAAPSAAQSDGIRCDRDGDRCWRVICDNDGDYCQRVNVNAEYYANRYRFNYNDYYDRTYGNGYSDNGNYYSNGHYGHDRSWVCDRDGDDCHWSYDRW